MAAEFDSEINFTYCTEFVVGRDPEVQKDPLELRLFLETIGDCVVVVVSEETGAIALAVGGKLERNLTPEQLKGRLEELLNISSSNEKTAIA